MTTQIGIDVLYGNGDVREDDRLRAEAAALAALGEVSPEAAYAEYQRQHAELDGHDMTGLALLWVRAAAAASTALTQGWANPAGATCTIYV